MLLSSRPQSRRNAQLGAELALLAVSDQFQAVRWTETTKKR
jgi:hypothetical protein